MTRDALDNQPPEHWPLARKQQRWAAQLFVARRRLQWASDGTWQASTADRAQLAAYIAATEAQMDAARRSAIASGARLLAAQRDAQAAAQRPRHRGGWTVL